MTSSAVLAKRGFKFLSVLTHCQEVVNMKYFAKTHRDFVDILCGEAITKGMNLVHGRGSTS